MLTGRAHLPAGRRAHESDREYTARLLARVADVVDPVTGTIRLKAKVRDVDEMTLDVASARTFRVGE